MSSRAWVAIASTFLVACVALGGASAAGALANAVLQLAAVLLILGLVWFGRIAVPVQARLLAWTIALFILLVGLTLVPMPLSLWRGLPYRGELAEGLRLLGVDRGSLAVSLAPMATIRSVLSLLPPISMFLLVTALPAERRNVLFSTLVALSVASVALGVFQLLGGPDSPLRFYEITNDMSAVGWFANVNHNATLALCALPCLAALAARFAGKKERSRRSGGFVIAAACAIFLLVGIGLMGSMAGYALTIPALVSSLLIYRSAIEAKASPGWRLGAAVVSVLLVAGALAGPLSQERLSAKFSDYPTSRRSIAETSIAAVSVTFPLGTGLGTFADVYRRFQDPAQASREYVNHAHDDYLEVALELGLPGLLLVLLFILWWIRRSLAAWRDEAAVAARAGSTIVGLVLLHSLADYPIRTAAIAIVFALGCALMVPAWPSRRSSAPATGEEKARHVVIGADDP